jgi:hypothetical protein
MAVDADPKKDVGIARWMDDDRESQFYSWLSMEQGIPKIKQTQNFSFQPKNQSAYKSIGMHYLTHSLTLFESRSLKEHMTVQEPDS